MKKFMYPISQTYETGFVDSKIHAFNLFLFGVPCNSTMFSIVTLYAEIFIIGLVIIYIIVEVMSSIIDEFKHTNNMYPFHFSPEMESFLDIFFLLFPSSVILYILTPTLGFLYNSEISEDTNMTSFSIAVTGHQWYWSYTYHFEKLNLFITFNQSNVLNQEEDFLNDLRSLDCMMDEEGYARLLDTNNKVVIPVCVPIRLDITSEDVIHSWSVPQLGIKVDAMPGRVTSIVLFSQVSGIFYGQCSELCGALHAFMPIQLYCVNPKIFYAWTINITGLDTSAIASYLDFITDIKNSVHFKKPGLAILNNPPLRFSKNI